MGVYEHLAHNRPPPWEFTRWRIAKEFGWTLDDVDNMTIDDYRQYLDIQAAWSMVAKRRKEKQEQKRHGNQSR